MADPHEHQLRVDLAAAFRLAAELGWHEAVANHFSLAVSADGKLPPVLFKFGPDRVAAALADVAPTADASGPAKPGSVKPGSVKPCCAEKR